MSDKQLEVLFRHFALGKSITTFEAMLQYGCARLSERVRELEAKGWTIDRAWERSANGKRVLRYWLAEQQAGMANFCAGFSKVEFREATGLGGLPGRSQLGDGNVATP